MSDFPIWMKLLVWGTIGLSVAYSVWSMYNSLAR